MDLLGEDKEDASANSKMPLQTTVNNFLSNPPPLVQDVHIFCDSISAIQAIKHPTSISKLIQLTWQSLSALDARYKWSLTWVKGLGGKQGK
jgi:hypothetical protein